MLQPIHPAKARTARDIFEARLGSWPAVKDQAPDQRKAHLMLGLLLLRNGPSR